VGLQSKLLTSLEVDLTSKGPLTQIKPGKLWDELATDLFLANIDKPIWGWSDNQTVLLLDFWRQFDPQVRFLLVYNSPANYIAQVLGGHAQPSDRVMTAALDEWARWNSALLAYQQLFPDVCTLVNSQLALANPDAFVSKLSSNWGLTGLKASAETQNIPQPIEQLQAYLTSHLLDTNHPTWALFQQLEAVALLPATAPSIETHSDVATAWGNLFAVKASMAHTEALIALASQKGDRVDELVQENDLMLLQMHQVQEELEHYFLLYQELDKKFHSKQDDFVSDFWVTHQPTEVLIDMRANIAGSNWHGFEPDGRWAGPGNLSTLQMPPVRAGNYALELEIVDAMDMDIVTDMLIEVHDKKISVKTSYPAGVGEFPVICQAKINLTRAVAKHPWAIGLRFPRLMSPTDRGSSDARLLAVRLRSLKLIKS